MQTNVLQYLEAATAARGDAIAYFDDTNAVTFAEVYRAARQLGSVLAQRCAPGAPVAVFAPKQVGTPALFLGVVCAGCCYVPLDADLPQQRLRLILELAKPKAVVCSSGDTALLQQLGYTGRVLTPAAWQQAPVEPQKLDAIRAAAIDTDPLYILFTSGSTGVPKGVVASHRNVIDYIAAVIAAFGFDENEVFGNQAPLDYIAAIRDIYLPLALGAKTLLIPKELFSAPQKLFQYVNRHGATTLCWVAPALALCAELGVFEAEALPTVRKVLFTGSVLPARHLRSWQQHLPQAMFANHYGPTEITASCTYYIVDHLVQPDETLPIGVPFANTRILLLNEDGSETPPGELGEICVAGAGLALGYYKDPAKTAEVFVQNPLQSTFSETLYKTGDLGRLQPDGMLTFHGRKDNQIKHMGHRVELGEVEAAALAMDAIQSCCCLYQEEKQMLWLFYTGPADRPTLSRHLRECLPAYMVPRKFLQLPALPAIPSGKPDIQALRALMQK